MDTFFFIINIILLHVFGVSSFTNLTYCVLSQYCLRIVNCNRRHTELIKETKIGNHTISHSVVCLSFPLATIANHTHTLSG